MAEKELIVVAGPKGAGKTTFANEYVALHGVDYLSADAIAERLSPGAPARAQLAAGREFIRRVDEALAGADSFLVESTLSGRTFLQIITRAKAAGFKVTILYVYLNSVDTCVDRVHERVEKGGHAVPESDVRRRFRRSIDNFWWLYRPLSDHWVLTYNASNQSQDVAIGGPADVWIKDPAIFLLFQQLLAPTNDG